MSMVNACFFFFLVVKSYFYSCGVRNVCVVELSVTALHVHYNAHSGVCIDNREYVYMAFFSST